MRKLLLVSACCLSVVGCAPLRADPPRTARPAVGARSRARPKPARRAAPPKSPITGTFALRVSQYTEDTCSRSIYSSSSYAVLVLKLEDRTAALSVIETSSDVWSPNYLSRPTPPGRPGSARSRKTELWRGTAQGVGAQVELAIGMLTRACASPSRKGCDVVIRCGWVHQNVRIALPRSAWRGKPRSFKRFRLHRRKLLSCHRVSGADVFREVFSHNYAIRGKVPFVAPPGLLLRNDDTIRTLWQP